MGLDLKLLSWALETPQSGVYPSSKNLGFFRELFFLSARARDLTTKNLFCDLYIPITIKN